MADPPRYPNASDNADIRRDKESGSGTPSRTKVLLMIIGISLLAVMIGVHLAGVAPH